MILSIIDESGVGSICGRRQRQRRHRQSWLFDRTYRYPQNHHAEVSQIFTHLKVLYAKQTAGVRLAFMLLTDSL